MSTSRSWKLAFAACALAALSGFASQDEHLLRRLLRADTSDVYDVSISGKQSVDDPVTGEQQITFSGTMTYTVQTGSVSAETGLADVSLVTSDIKFDAQGAGGAMPQGAGPQETTIRGKMDDRYRMSEVKFEGANPAMAMMASTMSGMNIGIELPEKPVKVGDSWEVAVPKNPFLGGTEQKLTATLAAVREHEAKAVFEIVTEGKLTLEADFEKLQKELPPDPTGMSGMLADMRATMKGEANLRIVTLLERGTCRILKMDSESETSQTMELQTLGLRIPMTGNVASSMTLRPHGAARVAAMNWIAN